MRITLWLFISIALLAMLLGSGAGGEEEKILDFSLCKGLDKDGFPLERVDKVSTEDERLLFWVFVHDVHKGDEMRWEFHGPQKELYESSLVIEEDRDYVGVQGELNISRHRNRLTPGSWRAEFYLNGEKLLKIPFTLLESTIQESKSLEEAVKKTVALLSEFGFQALEVNVSEDDQAYIRMNMLSHSLDQIFWNQIGLGFEALHRIFPETPWLLVQLIFEDTYLLSFQVKTSDFDYWRKGYFNSDEFWKKRVKRYVYSIKEKRDLEPSKFYAEQFNVMY